MPLQEVFANVSAHDSVEQSLGVLQGQIACPWATLTVQLSHLPFHHCTFAHYAATGCTYQPSHVMFDSSGMLPRACKSCQTSSCLLVVDHASYNIRTWPGQCVCFYAFPVTGTQTASSNGEGLLFLQHAVLSSADTRAAESFKASSCNCAAVFPTPCLLIPYNVEWCAGMHADVPLQMLCA